MKQGIMELDCKGIFPRAKENESKFYERGERFLETAYAFQNKKIKKKITRGIGDIIDLEHRVDINKEVEEFDAQFLTKPDWVSCFYGIFKIRDEGIKWGISTNIKNKKNTIPIISINCFLVDGFLGDKERKKTITHELIHAIRTPLEKISPINYIFTPFFMDRLGRTPEAFAYSLQNLDSDYLSPKPKILSNIIRGGFLAGYSLINFCSGMEGLGIAGLIMEAISLNVIMKNQKSKKDTKILYEKLEEIKKINASAKEINPEMRYALLRMTKEDILDLDSYLQENSYKKNSVKSYIKKQSSEKLRFKIMAERLG